MEPFKFKNKSSSSEQASRGKVNARSAIRPAYGGLTAGTCEVYRDFVNVTFSRNSGLHIKLTSPSIHLLQRIIDHIAPLFKYTSSQMSFRPPSPALPEPDNDD